MKIVLRAVNFYGSITIPPPLIVDSKFPIKKHTAFRCEFPEVSLTRKHLDNFVLGERGVGNIANHSLWSSSLPILRTNRTPCKVGRCVVEVIAIYMIGSERTTLHIKWGRPMKREQVGAMYKNV